MSDPKTRKVIGDLRGGRNGTDPPLALAENQVTDAVNVDWYRTTFAAKRNGVSAASTSFSSGGPFTGKVSALCRHVPGTDETVAEVWAIDDAATPIVGRKAGTSTFIAPTLKDALTGNAWDTTFATLNQHLFLAYKSGSGFSAPAAPTVANTGAGTYAATQRWYRVRWITQVSSVTQRRSPVGSSQSFTPSGAGSAARVTRPAAPGTGETHWELEVSYDNVSFKVLYGDGGLFAPIAIATTTGDDSATTTSTTIIDTFTSAGTWTRPSWVTAATYLVVGGGGAGGASTGNANGGGGAGGYLAGTDTGLASATYAVTVGAGGQTAQAAGGNSTWNAHTSVGGGGGGGGASGINGIAGGSGGGGGGQDNATGSGGAGTGGQGTAGGTGGAARGCHPCDPSGSGGGGGATSAGANGSFSGGSSGPSNGGNGGNGTANAISGVSVTYAAGGGGGGGNGGTAGTGGTGGGGNGGNGGAGSDGTGVGSGGGGSYNSNTAGKGTTGIVILSYSAPNIANAGASNADSLDRLHVWDGSTVRRTGFATPAAPTAANTGGGAYAATLRYYRVRWIQEVGGVLVRRSEAGPSVSFTPSGAGAAVRVTQPAVANEGETHWEVEVSLDNVTFYQLYSYRDNGVTLDSRDFAVAIATTTQDDSTATGSYAAAGPSALTGTYTPQKSYKYIAADQNRLLGFGNYVTTNKQNRVEFSAVVGALNKGDEERVDTTAGSYVDLDESDSGNATGLIGPALGGSYFPFKDKQSWQLTPTGQPTSPYRRTALSKIVGSVPNAQGVGEDAYGNAAIYWLSHRGPYRYTAGRGLEYLGHGIEDLILGPTSTINLTATNVIGRVAYHLEKRQVWFGVATGSSNDPNTLLLFDVVHAERTRDETGQITGGWSRVPSSDVLANLRALAMLPTTIGATMTRDLKPYIGSASSANKLYKCDDSAATDDAGTAFQAYVVTRPIEPGGAGFNGSVGEAMLVAKAASNVTITATITANFDSTRVQTGTCTLTPDGSETRTNKKLENSAFAESLSVVQYQLGDSDAVSNGWSLDRLTIPYDRQEAQ